MSKKIPYKELVKNCRSLYSVNLLLSTLLVRKLRNKYISRNRNDMICCRTCLRKDQLQPIFVEDEEAKISEHLLLATGLEIQKGDGFPQTICSHCMKTINNHLTFREDCKLSQEKLLKFPKSFQYTKPQPLPIKEIKNIDIEIVPEIKREENWQENYKFNGNNVQKVIVEKKNEENIKIEENIKFVYKQNKELYEKNKMIVKEKIKVQRQGQCSKKKEYKCHICNKYLSNSSSFSKHLNRHSGINSYICEACGKRCYTRCALQDHMKGQHGSQRTDKCNYCDYTALNKQELKIHKRLHTGERPYICDYCGAGFHRRAILVQHLPTHLTVKNVKCDLCPSTFKSLKFLATHKYHRHHYKKYYYTCHVCNAVYKKMCTVRKHLLKVHSIPREQQGKIARHRIGCFDNDT